jgi:hypothetical protein
MAYTLKRDDDKLIKQAAPGGGMPQAPATKQTTWVASSAPTAVAAPAVASPGVEVQSQPVSFQSQQPEPEMITVEAEPLPTLEEYLSKGKTAEQWFAETGQQSVADQAGGADKAVAAIRAAQSPQAQSMSISAPQPTLQEYLDSGKTTEQWFAETGQQSALDALGGAQNAAVALGLVPAPAAGKEVQNGSIGGSSSTEKEDDLEFEKFANSFDQLYASLPPNVQNFYQDQMSNYLAFDKLADNLADVFNEMLGASGLWTPQDRLLNPDFDQQISMYVRDPKMQQAASQILDNNIRQNNERLRQIKEKTYELYRRP